MKSSGITKKILMSLYSDNDYILYCKEYRKNHNINLILLKILLKKYSKLLEIFYKFNIYLYKYDVNIKSSFYIDNKTFCLEDIFVILNHYKNNYSRCKNAIDIIIKNNIVTKDECKLLQLIRKRSYKNEIL